MLLNVKDLLYKELSCSGKGRNAAFIW